MAAWTHRVTNAPLSGWHESVAVGTKIYHFELGDEDLEEDDDDIVPYTSCNCDSLRRSPSPSPPRAPSPPSPPSSPTPPCSLRVRIFDTEDFSWRTVPLYPSDTEGEVRRLPQDVESLVTAAHCHMVYILGTTPDFSVRCFDTRTLLWSCSATRGDVPRGAIWKFAYQLDGTIFVWGRHELSSKCVFALDVSTLCWRSVRSDAGPTTYQLSLAVALSGSIYVLYTRRPRLDAKRDDCRIAVFDTAHAQWQWRGEPYGLKLFYRTTCCVFVYASRIYALAMRNISSRDVVILQYCGDRNEWKEIGSRGAPPKDYLHSVSVVGCKAFFFSPTDKCVHVLDFSPNLRTLCILTVMKYDIDYDALPNIVRRELALYFQKP